MSTGTESLKDQSKAKDYQFEPLQKLMQLIEERANHRPLEGLPDRLPVSRIEEEPALFQPRSGLSDKHLGDLERAIEHFGDLDPVEVIQIGSRTVVVDGHHRIEAYRASGRTTDVPVKYFEGTVEEAVLAAGGANSKVNLQMRPQERQDYAWRLVLLGTRYSKAKIARAAGVGTRQVSNMRTVKKQLGDGAFQHRSWWQARQQADGSKPDLSEEEWEQRNREKAEEYADKMARMFSTKLAENAEVAAMTLQIYFGRRLSGVLAELTEYQRDEFEVGDTVANGEEDDF